MNTFSRRLPFGGDSFKPKSEWTRKPEADTLTLYIPGFRRNQVNWKIEESRIIRVSGDRPPVGNSIRRRFNEAYVLPENIKTDRIFPDFDQDGVFKFIFPREIVVAKEIITPTNNNNDDDKKKKLEKLSEITKLSSNSKKDDQVVVEEKIVNTKEGTDREEEEEEIKKIETLVEPKIKKTEMPVEPKIKKTEMPVEPKMEEIKKIEMPVEPKIKKTEMPVEPKIEEIKKIEMPVEPKIKKTETPVEPKEEEEKEENNKESRGCVVKKAGVGFIIMAVGVYVSYRFVSNRRSKSRPNNIVS